MADTNLTHTMAIEAILQFTRDAGDELYMPVVQVTRHPSTPDYRTCTVLADKIAGILEQVRRAAVDDAMRFAMAHEAIFSKAQNKGRVTRAASNKNWQGQAWADALKMIRDREI